MTEQTIQIGDRVRLTGPCEWEDGTASTVQVPEGTVGTVKRIYCDGDILVRWDGSALPNNGEGIVAASNVTRIDAEPDTEPESEPEPRVVRLEEVRVGDTIRAEWDVEYGDAKQTVVRTGVVSALDGDGEPHTRKGFPLVPAASVRDLPSRSLTIYLLPRPEPTLPTEPGSVILCAEVRGAPYDGIAVLDASGVWLTPTEVDTYRWHKPEYVGPGWRLARVVEADQ